MSNSDRDIYMYFHGLSQCSSRCLPNPDTISTMSLKAHTTYHFMKELKVTTKQIHLPNQRPGQPSSLLQ